MARADEEIIKLTLLRKRDFVTQEQLRRECELKHRSTVMRILDRLEAGGFPLEWDDKRRVRVDRAKLLELRLTLDEALAIYIACRLLARHSDRPNTNVVNSLTKVGTAIKGPAFLIGDHILETSERLRHKPTRAARDYVRILEALTRAWASRTRVELYTRKEPKTARTFDPYFVEPSMYNLYVFGYDHARQDMRTFRLQNLARVVETNEPFQVRPDFNVQDFLGNAWGVNWGKGKLEEVRLRFTGNAATRVQENVWHPSQKPPMQGEGFCELTFTIGDTLEMIPWIRQWGHECEVVAPEHLRKTIAEHAKKMAELYDNASGKEWER